MDSRARELIKQGDNLFSRRMGLLNLWQEIGENFFPMRADFQAKITPGDELTDHLSTSYPIIAHRDLSDAFTSMLRRGRYFRISTGREELDEGPAREWLEWASERQYRLMFDRRAGFQRAAKQGDQDLAAFGQCVEQVERNRLAPSLLYRTWHIRDCAWSESAAGRVDTMHRKWKPTARQIRQEFGSKVHSKVDDAATKDGKDPFQEIECRHVVIPTEKAGDVPPGERRHPYRSYYIDVEHEHVMEDAPSPLFMYVVPRWVTVSGSQYAYSPAAIAALPDARMVQAMTYTLLDAAEKATEPPLIGQADIVKSDVELWSKGITWVDSTYDERLGEAIRPVPLDYSGLPAGFQMAQAAQGMIAEAFYLNKISLPAQEVEMTAFETARRIEEYIRQALPLFEPLEDEKNGAECEMTFDTLMMAGAFGPPEDMPDELSDAEIEFRFSSPLRETEERQKSQAYLEARGLIDQAAAVDPSLVGMMDGREALRDALHGVNAPAKWLRTDDEMDAAAERMRQQEAVEETAQLLERGGQVAEQVGRGTQAMNEAIRGGT